MQRDSYLLGTVQVARGQVMRARCSLDTACFAGSAVGRPGALSLAGQGFGLFSVAHACSHVCVQILTTCLLWGNQVITSNSFETNRKQLRRILNFDFGIRAAVDLGYSTFFSIRNFCIEVEDSRSLCQASLQITESCGPAVGTSASCSGCPGFKYRPGNRPSFQCFRGFCSSSSK